MSDGRFSLPEWYALVGAGPRERNALRQDLVRGLKDYFESVYGYDRYGGETIFQLEPRLAEPYIYGFALARILRDRRVGQPLKVEAARYALDRARYGEDGGIPYGFLAAVTEVAGAGPFPVEELRYALTVSAGDQQPFRGLDRDDAVAFMRLLLDRDDMPSDERLFWAHFLLARHRDEAAAPALVDALLGHDGTSAQARLELCRAWLHFRQPRLTVEVPPDDGTSHGRFISTHMPFWVAHSPAWPSLTMVRRAPVWLARLGEDPGDIAERYLRYRGAFADQIHQGAAEVLFEHVRNLAPDRLTALLDLGFGAHLGVSARRALYRAGAEAFGSAYLDRAQTDAAGTVRAWAAKRQGRAT